jgi:tetratricopeptide (TPR) repeat protein
MKKYMAVIMMLTVLIGVSAHAGYPEDMEAAYALKATGDNAAARALFEQVISDYPAAGDHNLADTQYAVGFCYRDSANSPAAITAWKLAVSSYPAASDSLLAAITAHIGAAWGDTLGEQVKAFDAYMDALTDYPDADTNNLAIARLGVAGSLASRSMHGEALTNYLQVVSDYPTAADAYLADAKRGAMKSHTALGQPTDAIAIGDAWLSSLGEEDIVVTIDVILLLRAAYLAGLDAENAASVTASLYTLGLTDGPKAVLRPLFLLTIGDLSPLLALKAISSEQKELAEINNEADAEWNAQLNAIFDLTYRDYQAIP